MKNLLYFLLIAILFSCNTKHSGIIENPSYEAKTTGIYTIKQIEFTDTTTRVTVLSEFIPNWWVNYSKDDSLTDVETGESFFPIGIEGAEFDVKLWMPEDGDSVVTLIYPRIPDHVKKVDWQEGIYGISLNPKDAGKLPGRSIPKSAQKWLDKELRKTSTQPLTNFEGEDFFSAEPARLIGYIKGYDERYNLTTGIIYMENQFTREDYPVVVEIHPDGRFEVSLPMLHPIYSNLSIQRSWIPFYIEPGQTLAMILDWEDFLLADRYRNRRHKFEMIDFQGELATINKELFNFTPNEFDYKAFMKKVKTMSPEEFIAAQNESLQANVNLLNDYLTENTISEKAEILLKNSLLLDYGTQLYDFVDRREYATRQEPENEILTLPIPDDYYNFLQEIPLDSKALLIASDYSTFINRYEYSDPFDVMGKIKVKRIDPKINFYEYLVENQVEIPVNELRIFKALYSKEKSEEEQKILVENRDSINKLFQKNQSALNQYHKQYPTGPSYAVKSIKQWNYKDSILKSDLDLANNLTQEIAKVRSLKFQFEHSPKEDCNELWSAIKETLTEPFLIRTGDLLYAKHFPDEAVASYELPDEKGTEIFQKIIDPFKGKIIFVDFWATSCGPCVAGIERMKENREKYKDNPDFVFIFITDERSSPQERYDQFVAEQEMINTYRLTKDDYNYLRQLFKFNGIPRYVVIDKEGKVLNDNFSMYRFESELPGILEKTK